LQAFCMAGASRCAYGEDGIYFDHRGDCKDSTYHRTVCAGGVFGCEVLPVAWHSG